MKKISWNKNTWNSVVVVFAQVQKTSQTLIPLFGIWHRHVRITAAQIQWEIFTWARLFNQKKWERVVIRHVTLVLKSASFSFSNIFNSALARQPVGSAAILILTLDTLRTHFYCTANCEKKNVSERNLCAVKLFPTTAARKSQTFTRSRRQLSLMMKNMKFSPLAKLSRQTSHTFGSWLSHCA